MPSSNRLFVRLAEGLSALERALMPPACLLCGVENAARDGETLVCPLCRSRWRTVAHPVCVRCGETRTPGEPACRICNWWPQSLGRVRSAVWLSGGARQAVHLLKFEGWWRIAEQIARMIRSVPALPAANPASTASTASSRSIATTWTLSPGLSAVAALL